MFIAIVILMRFCYNVSSIKAFFLLSYLINVFFNLIINLNTLQKNTKEKVNVFFSTPFNFVVLRLKNV